MNGTVQGIVSVAVATTLLTLVYTHLYLQQRERYVGIWALAWALHTVRYVFDTAWALGVKHPAMTVGTSLLAVTSGLLLLWGGYVFGGRRLPRLWLAGWAAIVGWSAVTALVPWSLVVRSTPPFLFNGALSLATGVLFLRGSSARGLGARLTGWVLVVWGIHKAEYPLVVTQASLAPWGYQVSAVLALLAAIGLLLVCYEKALGDLRASESRYSALFQRSASVQLLFDPVTKQIVDANDAAVQFYGYPLDALRGMSLRHLDRLSEAEAAEVTQAWNTAATRYVRIVHYLAGGELRHIEAYGGRIEHAGRTLVLCVVHDVTARVAAEQALAESESRYRSLVEHASEAILIADRQGRYVDVNGAACRMIGCGREELLTRSVGELSTPESWPGRAMDFEELHRTGTLRREVEVVRADGSRLPVELSACLLPDGRLLGIARDISARRLAEAERQVLTEQLRQAQKMEAIGRLAGGIAHDFNNLLTTILGNADLLSLRLGDTPPEAAGDLAEIRGAADRAASLTRQLLAFSRNQVIDPRPVDLNQLVRGFERMMRRLIGEDIHVECRLQPRLPAVLADDSRIEQVLMNLVVNARDAMPEGGRLTVSTSVITVDAGHAHTALGPRAPGPHVRLSVADTGCGMDEATQARIFEPFFTTKPEGRGTGLGLATVFGIVSQCGGHIACDSEPGRGTTFHIHLPLAETPLAIAQELGASEALSGGETILLVEDEPGVRDLSRRSLELLGYRVVTAAGGQEALALARALDGSVDLLVTDVVMPDLNGRQVADAICTRFPRVKVLFVSGYPGNVIAERGILQPGTEYLSKPFSPTQLAEKVRCVLDRRPGQENPFPPPTR